MVTIPDYQTVMLPFLDLAADGEEHKLRDAVEELADHFDLTEDERKELLPSSSQATFDNRVGWARTYMKKAGLLESPRRGYFRIADQCVRALEQKPGMINVKFLPICSRSQLNADFFNKLRRF
jgi:restriction system protein